MAIVFELTVNFQSDEEAAYQFCTQFQQGDTNPINISNHVIELHKPFVSSFNSAYGQKNYYVSIVPVAIGSMVALDHYHGKERISLSTRELTELGWELYERLKSYERFDLALVGWDSDWIELEELRLEWNEEISDGTFAGLVVCTDLLKQLPESTHFAPFNKTHVWIPYKETKAW